MRDVSIAIACPQRDQLALKAASLSLAMINLGSRCETKGLSRWVV